MKIFISFMRQFINALLFYQWLYYSIDLSTMAEWRSIPTLYSHTNAAILFYCQPFYFRRRKHFVQNSILLQLVSLRYANVYIGSITQLPGSNIKHNDRGRQMQLLNIPRANEIHGQQARASENFAGPVDFETPRPDLPVHFLYFQKPWICQYIF